MKNFNEKEISFIKDNYPTEQTWAIAEKLNSTTKEISDIATKKLGLKKDKDFFVVRKENKLTLVQCQFILDNYSSMKNSEICNQLNLDTHDFKSFVNRRKLKKNEEFKESIKYSNDIIQYIVKNYPKMQTYDMSKELNLDEKIIQRLAFEHNIKKEKEGKIYSNHKNGLTIEQKRFIDQNYSTMKSNDLCKEIGITYEQMHNYATNKKLKKNMEVSKQPSGCQEILLKRLNSEEYDVNNYINNKQEPFVNTNDLYKSKYGKYNVNQNYFNKIDNEWKAYWLGFLYADGCNKIKRNSKKNNKMEYSLSLALCSLDKTHIEKFRKSIQSDAPILDKDVKLNGKIFKASRIMICNKNICESLDELGCTPNKSLTLRFPNEKQLPKKFIRDFIRGYFDGDGCISLDLDKRYSVVGFVGTKEFLERISKILSEELDIENPVLQQKKGSKCWNLQYGSIIKCNKIYNYLYKDCNIYLDRKLEKFNTLFCLD